MAYSALGSSVRPADLKSVTIRTTAALAVFVAAGYLLRGSLIAIAWSVLIAISTWPLHRRLQRSIGGRHPERISAALLTFAAALLLLLPVVILTHYALREVPALLRFWESSRDTGVPAPAWLAHLPVIGRWLEGQWAARIAEPGALGELLHGLVAHIRLEAGRGIVTQIAHRAMAVFFCVLVLFFVYWRGAGLAAQLEAVIARYLGPQGLVTTRMAVVMVRQTVNGLLLVGLGLAVAMSASYRLAGLPHPAFWGLLTGLLGIVPFGAGLALAGAAASLFVAQSTTAALVLLVGGAALIFVVDHFLRPLLIAGPSKLPFVLVLLGIVGGLETLGLLGLFVGPTLMAVTVAVWRELAAGAGRAAPESDRAA